MDYFLFELINFLEQWTQELYYKRKGRSAMTHENLCGSLNSGIHTCDIEYVHHERKCNQKYESKSWYIVLHVECAQMFFTMMMDPSGKPMSSSWHKYNLNTKIF
jgi:hypothetical protein